MRLFIWKGGCFNFFLPKLKTETVKGAHEIHVIEIELRAVIISDAQHFWFNVENPDFEGEGIDIVTSNIALIQKLSSQAIYWSLK